MMMILLAALLAAAWLAFVLYTVFFGALARIPGPHLWAASRLPWIYHTLRGTLAHRISELHAQYGEVVRIAPNEVSFTSADAWKAIYAYRPGIGAFPKNPIWHATKPGVRTNNISTANTQDHTRIRKALSRGFVPQMMPSQEVAIKLCVDKFERGLRERADAGELINIVDWMHFCSFDMISELGFGMSVFGCLDNGYYHPALITMMTTHPHMNSVCMRMVPFLEPAVNYIKSLQFWKKTTPAGMMVEIGGAINRRIAEEDTRKESPDLMSALIEGRVNGKISEIEMKATAAIVQGGGGGTTGSALSAAVNYLVRYPETLLRLTKEVRTSYGSPAEMTGEGLERLDYLNCVLEETLRLCPPVATGVPRMVPGQGDTVSGYWLPGFTNVAVHQLSTNRSPHLWAHPNDFRPERWLPEARTPRSPFFKDVREALHPFSLGPRRCIGERIARTEMRMVLATLVRSFDVQAAPGPVPRWEDQKTYPSWQKKDFFVDLVAQEY